MQSSDTLGPAHITKCVDHIGLHTLGLVMYVFRY